MCGTASLTTKNESHFWLAQTAADIIAVGWGKDLRLGASVT